MISSKKRQMTVWQKTIIKLEKPTIKKVMVCVNHLKDCCILLLVKLEARLQLLLHTKTNRIKMKVKTHRKINSETF